MDVVNSLVIILVANVVLYFTYRLVEFEWPERYFDPRARDSLFISQTFFRYASFRLVPPIALILVALGIAQKSGFRVLEPSLIGFSIGLIFSLINDGRAIICLFRRSPEIKIYRNYAKQVLFHVGVILSLAGTGLLSGYVSKYSFYYFLLPKAGDVVNNMWASFFTVMIIFIYKRTDDALKVEVNLDNVIKNSTLKLNPKILELVEKECQSQSANEILVKAVCLAENIERPKWFRRLEYGLSKLGYRGSYGIMQVQSDKAIGDEKSIEIATKKYFANTRYSPPAEIEKAIRRYNNDDHFVHLIEEIIKFITPHPLPYYRGQG